MTGRVTLAARIRELRRELAALEQQQHDDLVLRIVTAYEPGALLTVRGLWSQPDLRTAFEAAGIHSPQQLGIWLRQSGLVDRIGRDENGVVWTVSADDLHDDAGIPIDDGV